MPDNMLCGTVLSSPIFMPEKLPMKPLLEAI
jgi:hypothetical protein